MDLVINRINSLYLLPNWFDFGIIWYSYTYKVKDGTFVN